MDSDADLCEAALSAFGAAARRVLEPSPLAAAALAESGDFDIILCPSHVAFGRLRRKPTRFPLPRELRDDGEPPRLRRLGQRSGEGGLYRICGGTRVDQTRAASAP